jgi:hypothetical protein
LDLQHSVFRNAGQSNQFPRIEAAVADCSKCNIQLGVQRKLLADDVGSTETETDVENAGESERSG